MRKETMHKFSIILLIICAGFGLNGIDRISTYIPGDIPLPERTRPLQKAEEVEIFIPGIGLFPAGRQLQKTSLAGMWKFSGLESSETPFSSAVGNEAHFIQPEFDDSDWKPIKVPTNWWTVPDYAYSRIFRKSRKTNLKGQAYKQRTENPYCKGYYRKELILPEKLTGRTLLEFHAIGYEAELFVNGRSVGRHHGDFHTWTPDITEFVKPGRNMIALRVLADVGPHDEIYRHVYGAAWRDVDIKGGLWDHVFLLNDQSASRIERMLLTSDSTGKLRIDYRIIHSGSTPITVIPGIAVNLAETGEPAPTALEFPAVSLNPGVNEGVLETSYHNVKQWDTDQPNLYFATLYFREGVQIHAARVERFGFRDFAARNNQFYLNGKPVFLRMETVQSMGFSGDRGDPYARVTGFKKKGINILRTAHQPVTPRVYDVADEVGMMIYDEWALAFLPKIDPEVFPQNTLEELTQFILRDYNRPSVVMWVLGNEINHRNDPQLRKLLNDQVAVVRKLDLQKRPIAVFAGVGNVFSYGSTKLDTDIIDFHLYTGITRPWSQWDKDFQRCYDAAAKVYGTNGKLEKPIIISESIGGGWGLQPDPGYHHGNIDEYLERINRSFYWGNPGAAGYSGAIGIKAALDPARNWRYTQNLNGMRIVEMARQDPRIAGFGTWIAEIGTKQFPRWNQPVYAGVRISPEHRLMPLHYLVPSSHKLDLFLLNQGFRDLKNAIVKAELQMGGTLSLLAELSFGDMPIGARMHLPFQLNLPQTELAKAELRLTVSDASGECGRNSYALTLHSAEEILQPLQSACRVLLLAPHTPLENMLKDLQIPHEIAENNTQFDAYRLLILPPAASVPVKRANAIRNRIENGGTLLIMEQPCGKLPIFNEYQVTADSNSMVEIVAESHPLFHKLSDADFDIWAENEDGNVITKVLLPLDDTALAVKGRFLDERTCGTAIGEAKFGLGHVLFSQLDALGLWKRNGAASRYLRNLIAYATGNELRQDTRPLTAKIRSNYPIAHERIHFIDLKRHVNRAFADEIAGDGKGGWTDQGDNDFKEMPLGTQEGAGIPFQIINPAENHGNSCIVLRSRYSPTCPAAARGIPVNAKLTMIAFLHTAGYGGSDGVYGTYRMRYTDGTYSDCRLLGNDNIANWWNPRLLPNAIPAFVRKNAMGHNIGLFVTQWKNPRPEKEIATLDFFTDGRQGPMPILVAATGELVHPEPLSLYSSGTSKPHWGCTADNGGDKSRWELLKINDPAIGKFASRIHFPATKHFGYAAAILFCFPDPNRLLNNNYDYLSIVYRSSDSGMLELTVPQAEHRSRLTYSINLGNSRGKWVKLRLNLKEDFKLEGEPFDIHDMRKEIIFYNGRDKSAGFPRGSATIDIADIRLE